MTIRHRSSSLRYFVRNCPKALGFYEDNAPADRSIFQTGIAAHAVLQAVTDQCNQLGRPLEYEECIPVAEQVFATLIAEGRSFDKKPEPPMQPDAAVEGKDLALQWLLWNPPSHTARAEVGLAMRADGTPCDYHAADARYVAILDEIDGPHEIGDEDYNAVSVSIADHKTAWPTDVSELMTMQFRGQAVLVATHYPEATEIVQAAHNLRTRKIFEHRIHPHEPEGRELIEQWRADIFALCDAADKTREARPGHNCLTCTYAPLCDDAWQALTGNNDLVSRYAMIENLRGQYKDVAVEACQENARVTSYGTVGYHAKEIKKPTAESHRALIMEWFDLSPEQYDDFAAENASLVGLLRALKLSNGNHEAVAKALYPGRGTALPRAEYISKATESAVQRRFGVEAA